MSAEKSAVTIIDYGVGNLTSLRNAFGALSIPVQISSDIKDIESAEKLLLPGVGAFAPAMQQLIELKLAEVIREKARQKTPLLGICLGMQLFFTTSHENGEHHGLGLIPGEVRRLTGVEKIPHMGWNNIEIIDQSSAIMKRIASGTYFYFVHSYYCDPSDQNDVVATCQYGAPFAASVNRENIWGVQFHPEKSQKPGLQLLSNFAAIGKTDATHSSD